MLMPLETEDAEVVQDTTLRSASSETTEDPGNGFKCNICQKSYKRRYNLTQHMNLHLNRTIKCHLCDYVGVSNAHIKSHIALVHVASVEDHKCDKCPKTFKSHNGLKNHLLAHTNDFKFLCPHCGVGYMYKSEFDAHCGKHENRKPYQCKVCDKTFTTNSNMRAHERAAHKEVKVFNCMECTRTFSCKSYLQQHMHMHMDTGKYQCPKCKHAFKHRSSLAHHKKKCGNKACFNAEVNKMNI